jgi:hypothetical protein
MNTLENLHPFLRGYLEAALWTTDPDAHGGCDYAECGRAEEMVSRIPQRFIDEAIADCDDFAQANAELLAQAGTHDQNGHDFWLTRNGHGVGFWDRGYGDVGKQLTDACKPYSSHDLELGGWWENSYECKCGESWTRPEDSDNDPDFGQDTCDTCGATVESDNRKYGEHMKAIDEPEDQPTTTST